ncbi:MAG: glycosyltransferase family 2 protein, partial [Elioraea sp.]|nr:glycosyltransferase family 2 protein [Elioraea sp.]
MDFSVAVTVLSAVWALSSLSATVATAAYRAQLRPLRPIPALGRVAVILPVRSPAPQLPAALNALQAQNWPNLRLLVVLESEADPAFAVVRAAASADPRVVPVLAGESSACGQKVHNLLAGLGHLDQDVHIVVFVDADAIPPPDFLRILLRPILVGRTRVSSGYRVLVPEPGPLGALLAAIADHAVATFP